MLFVPVLTAIITLIINCLPQHVMLFLRQHGICSVKKTRRGCQAGRKRSSKCQAKLSEEFIANNDNINACLNVTLLTQNYPTGVHTPNLLEVNIQQTANSDLHQFRQVC